MSPDIRPRGGLKGARSDAHRRAGVLVAEQGGQKAEHEAASYASPTEQWLYRRQFERRMRRVLDTDAGTD
jgi:hypothetical protein